MTPDLQNYIAQSRQQGMTDDQIRQNLVGQGWGVDDVNQSLSSLSMPTSVASSFSKMALATKVLLISIGGIIIIGGAAFGYFKYKNKTVPVSISNNTAKTSTNGVDSLRPAEEDRLFTFLNQYKTAQPFEVAETLAGLDSTKAWGLRDELKVSSPAGVLLSLAGLDTDRAWQMRDSLYNKDSGKEADVINYAESLNGLVSQKAWTEREKLLSISPYGVLLSLAGIDSDQASQMRDRILNDKNISQKLGDDLNTIWRGLSWSIAGVNNSQAWKFRSTLIPDSGSGAPSFANSLTGLDTQKSWELRHKLLADTQSGVAVSLMGMDNDLAWAFRDYAKDKHPDAVAISLTGLTSDRAWQLREELKVNNLKYVILGANSTPLYEGVRKSQVSKDYSDSYTNNLVKTIKAEQADEAAKRVIDTDIQKFVDDTHFTIVTDVVVDIDVPEQNLKTFVVAFKNDCGSGCQSIGAVGGLKHNGKIGYTDQYKKTALIQQKLYHFDSTDDYIFTQDFFGKLIGLEPGYFASFAALDSGTTESQLLFLAKYISSSTKGASSSVVEALLNNPKSKNNTEVLNFLKIHVQTWPESTNKQNQLNKINSLLK